MPPPPIVMRSVMVAPDMQAVYGEMESCCREMASSAGQENWEAFLLNAARFTQLSSNLGDINWSTIPERQRGELAEVMRSAQGQIDAVLPLAEARRLELIGSIRELKNGEKMRRVYGT